MGDPAGRTKSKWLFFIIQELEMANQKSNIQSSELIRDWQASLVMDQTMNIFSFVNYIFSVKLFNCAFGGVKAPKDNM